MPLNKLKYQLGYIMLWLLLTISFSNEVRATHNQNYRAEGDSFQLKTTLDSNRHTGTWSFSQGTTGQWKTIFRSKDMSTTCTLSGCQVYVAPSRDGNGCKSYSLLLQNISTDRFGEYSWTSHLNGGSRGCSSLNDTFNLMQIPPAATVVVAEATAVSVRLEWRASFAPPKELNITPVIQMAVGSSWVAPASASVYTSQETYNTGVVLNLNPQTSYRFRLASRLGDKLILRSGQNSTQLTTKVLPVIESVEFKRKESSVVFTWQQQGGAVSHVQVCVRPEGWEFRCTLTKSFSLQDTISDGGPLAGGNSKSRHSVETVLSGNLKEFRYRLEFYDSGIMLMTSDWYGGSGDKSLAIALGVTVPIILILSAVVVSVVVVSRRQLSGENSLPDADVPTSSEKSTRVQFTSKASVVSIGRSLRAGSSNHYELDRKGSRTEHGYWNMHSKKEAGQAYEDMSDEVQMRENAYEHVSHRPNTSTLTVDDTYLSFNNHTTH